MAMLGEEFAFALARRDTAALRQLLRSDLDFRAMTPARFWEAGDADTVIDDIMLGTWFKPPNKITEVLGVETAAVGLRERVGYRFHVENPDGQYLVEQQAYYERDGDRIGWLRVMCAGYQDIP